MWQGHGVAAADYDGDGFLDVYIASRLRHDPFNPRSWNRLFKGNGDGTFTETTDDAGVRVDFLPELPLEFFGNKASVAWGDYDRDGDPDLLLTHVGPEVLFRNNGDGTFTDVADDAGLNGPDADTDESMTSGASWWDFNLDGYLDLYLSSWNGPNRFYRNNGDGTFDDISAETGLDLDDRTWMSMSWDVDRDGWPDLYLANDFGPNMLFRNLGDGSFQDVTVEWGLGDPGESMGLALGDTSGDQLPELFITNNAVRNTDSYLNTFFLGSESGPLQEVAVALGLSDTDWAWGTEFADMDLDGDSDLLVVNGALIERDTPNRYFRNMLVEEGSMRWVDVSASTGMDGRAESHGLLLLDANRDGALDMIITNWDEPLYYLQHPGSSLSWLKVRLVGVSSNPDGVGAEIRVTTGNREQVRFHNGVDFLGQNVQPAHFGLGSESTYDTVEVIWPGGMHERWEGGTARTTRTLVQGTGSLIATDLESSDFPETTSLDVYPIPASDRLTIRLNGVSTWEAVDILGRIVSTGRSGADAGGMFHVDVTKWSPGLYLIRTFGQSGLPGAKRAIVVSR